jgi:2-methylisocitrate lyase-like PEP mutase family enzyme
MIRAGVAAIHMEDQVAAKRCGHRPGKALVDVDEMADRLRAAVDARTDPGFVIMARTDAYAAEGIQAAIERACAYVQAGADMIFAEALETLEDYRAFTRALEVPVLANITEFGRTPLFSAWPWCSIPCRRFAPWAWPHRGCTARSAAMARNARWWVRCRPAPSSTRYWATTPTSASWTRCLERGIKSHE